MESELIEGCQNRDRQSQSKLYSLLAPKMLVVCLRYTKSREEAEEVLQKGFLIVFQKISLFRFEGSLEGWVRKIMVNCALQEVRAKSPMQYQTLQTLPDIEDKEYILPEISAKELIALIQKLPPMYRAVFNLYVFEGMKHKEIASLLNISEGTSKSNLSDAKKILQKTVMRQNKV
ncbi:RNA polymerase sigma factor [Adhaeribacter aquaticus]|uniref:RNA polymerase sigma factor n=1 Tax=Adhaeribacter aquaticus TaxID=299567 RepID=UPI00047B8ABF|nr:sigma-70 family RNA polymerase sigma factor [Adhaeribacter aquaticus]